MFIKKATYEELVLNYNKLYASTQAEAINVLKQKNEELKETVKGYQYSVKDIIRDLVDLRVQSKNNIFQATEVKPEPWVSSGIHSAIREQCIRDPYELIITLYGEIITLCNTDYDFFCISKEQLIYTVTNKGK